MRGQPKYQSSRPTLLSDASGRPFTGDATVYAPTDKLAGRFDPEGIRLSKHDTLLISDEYGPQVIEFSLFGKEQRRFPLPAYFSALHPGDSKPLKISSTRPVGHPTEDWRGWP